MFPVSHTSAQDTTEEKDEPSEEETVTPSLAECRGWRWPISLLVGPALASSPHLPLFLMVMTGDFLATMSIYIPYTHLPTMAVSRGVKPEQAAFLISAAGISSTVGRVLATMSIYIPYTHLPTMA